MRLLSAFALICLSLLSSGQINYDKYFTDKVLRFDFMLAGNSQETVVYPVGMKEEPIFAGSRKNLIDPFNYGTLKYEVFDIAEEKLIYSRGYCSLYNEWQTTAEARKTQRSFYETATFPFPKNKINFVLSLRERNGKFIKLYETIIDPEDFYINRERSTNTNVTKIHNSGSPEECLDLVFISEGYRADEMDKFREDVRRMTGILFAEAPFCDLSDHINIWAVEAVSSESGTDIPGEKIYSNTALNSGFYTFGTDRYLTTQDIRSVNDFAAAAPHDNIIVLINSHRYGGGGIYNYYSCTTVDHEQSPHVFLHEFGHSLAGLADEYYTSVVAYEEFYPPDVEPWEPNITTMVDFDSKWKDLITEGTPLPTPPDIRFEDKTGLFEGGGYSAKGIFRPELDCRMKTNGPKGYCTVCRDAIRKMIGFYTNQTESLTGNAGSH
jgi:hypothetical protein